MKISTQELPLWMQQARSGVDWGVLVVIVLSLLAAWPFFLQDGLPRTNASENYVYRTSEYAIAFSEGRLYPRWSAAAQSGYGAPIPHYYPPGAPYTAALVETLITGDAVTAVRLVYIGSLVLAGASTYAFVLRWGGARAGILAAGLYVYSPYVGLTAPHIIGDLPGVIGLALLPALVWSVNRLLTLDRQFDFLFVALITAALALTDVRLALGGGMLALGLIGWYAVNGEHRMRILPVLLAGLIGVGLASFFWLPALLEEDAVQWKSVLPERSSLELTLAGLFAPVRRVDLAELVHRPQLAIGLGGVLFAILGGISTMRYEIEHRALYGLFLALGVLILLAGVIIFPREIWLLGPAMLCLSLGGSAALRIVQELPAWLNRISLPVLLAFVLVLALPVWLPPRWEGSFGGTGLSDQIEYQQQGYGTAVLPPGAPVPSALPDDVPPNPDLIASYLTDEEVVRLPQSQVLVQQLASLLESGTHFDRYLVNVAETTVFNVLRAYFPGWQITLDGAPIELEIDEATGLIKLVVPPTTSGNVLIRLDSTRTRQVAWAISWSLLLLVVAGVLFRPRDRNLPPYDRLDLITQDEARILFVFAGAFLIVILLFAGPEALLTLHAAPGHRLKDTEELHRRTEAGLETVAYTLDQADQSIDLMLAWQATRPLEANYRVQVALQAVGDDVRYVVSEPRTPGGYPARRWPPFRYVRDVRHLTLPPDAPPGDYRIVVEVYECTPQCLPENRLNFSGQNENMIGPSLILPPVVTLASN